MGNHHTHDKTTKDGAGSGANTPRGGSRRGTMVPHSDSGSDIQEKPMTSVVPVEKLCKLLCQRAQKEDGINGVTENAFVKYVFPRYTELGYHLFQHLHKGSKSKNRHITSTLFKTHCDRLLAMIDDTHIVETYVRMFSSAVEDCVENADLRLLLRISYQLSMDHYPEGPQACFLMEKTMDAILLGCFNSRSSHSVGFVVRWLIDNTCHRLILPTHRYVVHVLSTRHRSLSEAVPCPQAPVPVELGTPVLERGMRNGLLPVSGAWLLAAVTAPLFTRPTHEHTPGGLSSAQWISRLVCLLPSHWTPLYTSQEDGLGANRFLHHVTAYRGPTILVLSAGEVTLAVSVGEEWRESQHYWGGPHCALVQLYPTFSVVQRGAKMVYLNTSIRGYPRGLRVGTDPKAPAVTINDDFDTLTFQEETKPLRAIEVWGCGDTSSRETQLEIKKWQVKEAERQRQVKLSAADWIEHPDRYLLELAGRPQYNNSAN